MILYSCLRYSPVLYIDYLGTLMVHNDTLTKTSDASIYDLYLSESVVINDVIQDNAPRIIESSQIRVDDRLVVKE